MKKAAMRLKELCQILESWAPLHLQESYDNCGLLVGKQNLQINGVLCSLDVTEEVLKEAKKKRCNVVIAHHPPIFGGLNRINGNSLSERVVEMAIKKDIAIYAIHTNLDAVKSGVNQKLADKIGLVKDGRQILRPRGNELFKFVTFVPHKNAEKVRMALLDAGGGNIGNYSHASFSSPGTGTFLGNESSNPKIGNKGKLSKVKESKIEFLLERHLVPAVLRKLNSFSFYEEKAYDLIPLGNKNQETGSGQIGYLEKGLTQKQFLDQIKRRLKAKVAKHTLFKGKKIEKVALCGGAGSFLIQDAVNQGADAYVTSDLKYHDYFEVPDNLLLVDIGHYESEQFTSDLIFKYLKGKISSFAVHISRINTNPVKYY